MARFTRTLGTMISLGRAHPRRAGRDGEDRRQPVGGEGIYYVRTKISEGKNIAQPLAETKVFPPMVVQMIGVGEATGAMDPCSTRSPTSTTTRWTPPSAALTAMIEPLMMVFLGGVVGGFLIAMYLPIFTIAGAIK